MTVDERIERLTERHEALAQSVELLVLQGEQTRKTVDLLVLSVTDLVGIVRSHENRIEGLESR